MQRRYRYALALAAVALLLIAARAALPHVIRDHVNDRLAALDSYQGRVADIDLALWRGAYGIDDLRIEKRGAGTPVPFFSSERIDLSIEWRSLFKGSLVSSVVFLRPRLNLVQARSEQQSQLGQEVNWAARLEELFPFRFNTVQVHDGTVTFRAPGIRSEDALQARGVAGELSNLGNVVESGKETFAHFRLAAGLLEGGSAKLAGSVDPLARQPTFDVDLTVTAVELPQLNPWLREFIKADAESGRFELYLELAAADGKFQGYAKPVLKDVNIYSSEEPERNPLRRLWEGVVELAANLLENDQAEQVAARIPFSGTISDPEAGIFAAAVSVLRNAFVAAFARSLEGSISVRNVRKNLEDIGREPGTEPDRDADRDDRKREERKKKRAGPRG